ncbi:Enoyl-[acyl-carrier-protein] reductase [NADH] [Frankliniella fusca]|uniref:Enoyl-[acyl-carrier-protein] reductase [NADH] n=1 Tax=Frankliniella fusca TaxID=407009 RepID=A0AAE1GXM1_9NEOP|nr:Enoyl-[acyl-carrier-protein] reductase [NADH] [Frankliniella fusca]
MPPPDNYEKIGKFAMSRKWFTNHYEKGRQRLKTGWTCDLFKAFKQIHGDCSLANYNANYLTADSRDEKMWPESSLFLNEVVEDAENKPLKKIKLEETDEKEHKKKKIWKTVFYRSHTPFRFGWTNRKQAHCWHTKLCLTGEGKPKGLDIWTAQRMFIKMLEKTRAREKVAQGDKDVTVVKCSDYNRDDNSVLVEFGSDNIAKGMFCVKYGTWMNSSIVSEVPEVSETCDDNDLYGDCTVLADDIDDDDEDDDDDMLDKNYVPDDMHESDDVMHDTDNCQNSDRGQRQPLAAGAVRAPARWS